MCGEKGGRGKGRTYGTPSYANVQSYTNSTVPLSSCRQNDRPVLLGNSAWRRSGMSFLSAHFLLAVRPFLLRLVPSGKRSNHMGSRPLLPDNGPLWLVESFLSLCWKRSLSVAHLRERKMKP